jgi:hypothetical protein
VDATHSSTARRPAITLLGLDGCPGAAELRAYLSELGVPFADVPLGPSLAPDDDCGYVSPSVQIVAGLTTDLLVRPSTDELFDALRRGGYLRGPAFRTARREAASGDGWGMAERG